MEYISINEAAKRLGVGRAKVRDLIRRGIIVGAKENPLDARYKLIPVTEVERLLAETGGWRKEDAG